jgi:hypothetical protein
MVCIHPLIMFKAYSPEEVVDEVSNEKGSQI